MIRLLLPLTLLAACGPKPAPDDTSTPSDSDETAETADSGESGDSGAGRDWWADTDEDGWGAGEPTRAVEPPPGFVDRDGDCAPDDPARHPGAAEVCDGLDDDCDRNADPPDQPWYRDADGDGWGDPADAETTCLAPEGRVADGGDCDDGDATVHPGAEEACDGDDDNCDGRADLGEVRRWYTDDDADGWGHPAQYEDTCDPEPGWVLVGEDCRPNDPEAHPEAVERCNDTDDDCDGATDEDFEQDGDGHRSAECGGDDCDDGDAQVYPGAPEVCDDGLDADCDGRDTHCAYDGSYDLGAAHTKAWSPGPAYDAGRQVEFGDVDGDGDDEVLVATLYAWSYAGGAFLVTDTDGSGALDTVGYELSGSGYSYEAGRAISLGDLDGDGRDDVVVGSPAPTDKAFVFFGPVEEDRALRDADLILSGRTNTEAGHGVAVGDVTGDGQEDAVVGAYEDNDGDTWQGITYVVEGPLAAGADDLGEVAISRLLGEIPQAYAGRHLRVGEDVDGDGIGDMLVAAPYQAARGTLSGACYVVYGGVRGDVDLGAADGKFIGEGPNDYAGTTLGMGDVNGDGLADLALGSTHGESATGAGTAYVVYGPASGEVDLGAADVLVRGTDSGQYLGSGVAVYDVDRDGYAELLVGGNGDDGGGSDAGAAWLYYGPLGGTYAPVDADALFEGEAAGDEAGMGVGMGDIDGDGVGDLGIGAVGESTGGSSGGAVYLLTPDG